MGEPDVVYEAPFTYDVPADGYVDYKYTLLPAIFLHDTYIQAAEVQPSNPRVVHHSNLGYMPIGDQGMYAKLITGYVPGVGPMQLDHNVASKIPAGSAIGLQIHLTTTGKPEKTRLRVGFRYPRYKVDKELHYLQLSNQQFAIPPFAAHYPVSRTKTLADDVTLYGFFAHMHVRGQDVTFKAYPPKRDPVTLLMIPNYRLRLADAVSLAARRSEVPGEHEVRVHGPLRQHDVQSVQSRPFGHRPRRPADVPGNDVRLHVLHQRQRAPRLGDRYQDRAGASRRVSPKLAAASATTIAYRTFFPGPYTARPGLAPVCSPSLITCLPFTNT